MKTKHLTIMFTDIKGFTSRTSKSSREQLHQLLELHDKLIIPVFEKFDGTIVKTIGDAFMVTFHSPTDAILCGMKIQKVLAKHNEEISDDEQLQVRIAINSGEVSIKGNDVFGEAVNIAARLEGIADAGDIYFTESVYLAMNKSEIPTAEVGHRHFKGVPEEIKVYKVLSERTRKRTFFRRERPVMREPKKRWKTVLKWVAIIFVILVILSQCDEKNKERKNPREDRGGQELREELKGIANDVIVAIEEGDERKARKGLDILHEYNNEWGHPEELDQGLREMEELFKMRFK